MADILSEVEDEIKEERSMRAIKQYAILFGAVAVVAVVGTAGWQWWNNTNLAQYEEVGDSYYKAEMLSAEGKDEEALAEFSKLANSNVDAVQKMSLIKRASLLLEQGKYNEARQALAEIGTDGAKEFVQLSELMKLQVYIQEQGGVDESALSQLEDLSAEGNIFRYTAMEILAFYHLNRGERDKASELFATLSLQNDVPDSIKQRANEVIKSSGLQPPSLQMLQQKLKDAGVDTDMTQMNVDESQKSESGEESEAAGAVTEEGEKGNNEGM